MSTHLHLRPPFPYNLLQFPASGESNGSLLCLAAATLGVFILSGERNYYQTKRKIYFARNRYILIGGFQILTNFDVSIGPQFIR